MAKIKCSEMASTLMDIARWHVKNGASDIDAVVDIMIQTMPNLSRTRIVDSIIEASESNQKVVTSFQGRLARVKREARRDKDLTAAITELETHLDNATLPGSKAAPSITRADSIQQLTEKRDQLLKALNKSEPALRQKYEASLKKSLARLEDGSLDTPAVRESEIEGSTELQRLRFLDSQAKLTVRRKVDDLRPTGAFDKVIEGSNAARVIMTTGEFSTVLRQGRGLLIPAGPKKVSRALVDMFQSFADEQKDFNINERILNDPDFLAAQRAGLAITDLNGPLSTQEDDLMSKVATRAPLIARFSRANNTFLNSLRLGAAKGMKQFAIDSEPTPAEWESIANTVNMFSGRGNLGEKGEKAVQLLNASFFSPRYQMSRLQMLTGQPVWKGATPEIRRGIIKDFDAKNLIGMASTYALYGLAFGDDEGFSLSFNPFSSEFGKIRLGSIVIDPLAGLSQMTTFLARTAGSVTETVTGKDVVGEEFRQGNFVTNFLRSKSSPGVSFGLDLITGKDLIGQETSLGGELLDISHPITYGDIAEIMQTEHSFPKELAISMATFLGEGVQVFEKRENKNSLRALGLDSRSFKGF